MERRRYSQLPYLPFLLLLLSGLLTALLVPVPVAAATASNENVTLVAEYGPCWEEGQNYSNVGVLAVQDQIAYVSCRSNATFYVEHVSRYDVSSPSNPQKLDNVPSSEGWKEMWFGDGW